MTGDIKSAKANDGESSRAGGLLKALGVWFGISVAIGNTIAAGIVRTPGDIARWLPDPTLFLGVWIIGGLYALFGASSLSELAVAIPKSGGQYNYSRKALGEYAGFVVGWSDWLSNCGTLAAVAIVVGEYTGDLIPVLDNYEKAIAFFVIIFFTLLQSHGIDWGSRIQVVTALLKTIAFMILVSACFILGSHSGLFPQDRASQLEAQHMASHWLLVVALMKALQAVFYSFDGWHGVIYLGGEIKEPEKSVPRTIFISVFSVVTIYFLLNAAVLYVLPIDQIAGNNFALGLAAEKVFGALGGPVIRVIMIVSLLSCINAVLLFSSRILYGLSLDGLFFKGMASVNEGGTPIRALYLSIAVAFVFVLGTFEQVMAILSFFFVANYALSYISLFVLRRREPDLKRPYLAWGYPWTTALALLFSIAFLAGALITNHEQALVAFLILLLSYPLFLYFRKLNHCGNPQ